MALLSRFRKKQYAGPWPTLPDYPDAWRVAQHEYVRVLGMTPADMWRTQPYLRTVVSFLARNIAQLGLHCFVKSDELDRQRRNEGALVDALRRPNKTTTAYELIHGTVSDLALYDRAAWLLGDADNPIVRVPPTWVEAKGGDMLAPDYYDVRANDRGEVVEVPVDQLLVFHGWHPESLQTGSTPVHALRSILAEQVQAAAYREALWQRGGKVGSVIERPADAPEWSDKARERFKADLNTKFTGQGVEVGGIPLLEDGMTLRRVDFSAKEQEYVEGSKLALVTVASAYFINPTMVGLLDNANYSNVKEFRRMLYGDTLGPVLAQLEDRLNAFLVPRFDDEPEGVYVEFNVSEKMQGSFEEQAAVISSSTGAPWMTRDEARARFNLPAIDGGDQLVTPLNVITGGLASPRDTAPDETQLQAANVRAIRAKTKQRGDETHEAQAWALLARFFRRQGDAVRKRLRNMQLADAWDDDRWDRELADDLLRLANLVTADVAGKTLEQLGFDTDAYDADRTLAFLRKVCETRAARINKMTREQLAAADDDEQAAHVFENAAGSRAAQIATAATTAFAGFAAAEAGKQAAGGRAVKTWLVNSTNPRPEHAAMNGETVPVDQPFSNGLMWPGDASGDVHDTAGCMCGLAITIA